MLLDHVNSYMICHAFHLSFSSLVRSLALVRSFGGLGFDGPFFERLQTVTHGSPVIANGSSAAANGSYVAANGPSGSQHEY